MIETVMTRLHEKSLSMILYNTLVYLAIHVSQESTIGKKLKHMHLIWRKLVKDRQTNVLFFEGLHGINGSIILIYYFFF